MAIWPFQKSASAALARAVAAAGPLGSVGEDDMVLAANPAMDALICAPGKRGRGRLVDIFHPADAPTVASALVRARAGETIRFLAALTHGDGRAAEATLSPAGPGELALQIRDRSADRLVESALKDERARAEAAARARAEMLADMSHEIRTPLNAVIGFADALRSTDERGFSVERAKEYAELIHKGGRHVLDLVTDVLDMSKIDAGKYRLEPQPTDVAAVVAECGELVRLAAERSGLRFTIDVDRTAPVVSADPRALRQILLNLLSNAVKFTERGGVTLRMRNDEESVWVSVIDTGVGMAAEDVERIGERYLDPAAGRSAAGTGLGLALARALAELHDGELRFDSKPGRGTSATLRLPIVGVGSGAGGDADPAGGSVLERIARVREFGERVAGGRGAA